MKNTLIVNITILMCFGLTISTFAQNNKGQIKFKSQMDTVSYIIGTNMGASFKQNGIEINKELMLNGMDEGLNGNIPLFSDSVIKKVMTSFQKEMMAKQDSKKKDEAEKNKKEGAKFMSENKKKDGVVSLPNGMQYKILKAGTGAKPIETDMVKVNYEGRLLDGKIFDSSYERKEPASFPLNQVIKGWTEGLQLMPVGSTWELYIPAELAYGDRQTGNIPSGATLIFKVELLSIEKKDDTKKEEEPVKKEEKKK